MILFIILSLILNLLLIYNFKKLSILLNIFDIPDDNRKLHKNKVASIGGVIFFCNFVLFFIFLIFYNNFLDDYKLKFLNGNKKYFSFFIIPTLIFLVGILDDKVNLSAVKKSVLFIILIFFSNIDQDLSIRFINLETLNYIIDLNQIGIFFSIISIFYFMNALNMFDGIDLQTPLYIFLIFLFLLLKGEPIVIFLIIPAIFFLYLNYRGKCFLGNSGSYLLGFIISLLLIKINQSNPNKLTAEEVLIILSLPCFELFRLFLERIIDQKNPFSGDRNHVHHLLNKKFNNLQTALITNCFIFLPLIISQFIVWKIIIFIFQFILYYLIIYKFKKI